jgi:hypothetical protein
MKTGAIYARVSSDKQKEEKTIGSQIACLEEFAQQNGYIIPEEWMFQDEGYSGSTIIRPGLEKLSAGTQNRPLLGTLKPAIFRVIEMNIFIILSPDYRRKRNGKRTEDGKATTCKTIAKAWLVLSQNSTRDGNKSRDCLKI